MRAADPVADLGVAAQPAVQRVRADATDHLMAARHGDLDAPDMAKRRQPRLAAAPGFCVRQGVRPRETVEKVAPDRLVIGMALQCGRIAGLQLTQAASAADENRL